MRFIKYTAIVIAALLVLILLIYGSFFIYYKFTPCETPEKAIKKYMFVELNHPIKSFSIKIERTNEVEEHLGELFIVYGLNEKGFETSNFHLKKDDNGLWYVYVHGVV